MTVEPPSFLIDKHKPTSTEGYGAVEFKKGDSDYTVVGALVPDSRLQAIADAWKAHKQAMGEGQFRDTYATLYALLDALTEDNNDTFECDCVGRCRDHSAERAEENNDD